MLIPVSSCLFTSESVFFNGVNPIAAASKTAKCFRAYKRASSTVTVLQSTLHNAPRTSFPSHRVHGSRRSQGGRASKTVGVKIVEVATEVTTGALQVTTGHYRSLQVTTGHYRVTTGSLQVTTGHYRSLRVTTGSLRGHYGSLQVTTGHYRSLRVTTGHYEVTTGHYRSLRGHYRVTTTTSRNLLPKSTILDLSTTQKADCCETWDGTEEERALPPLHRQKPRLSRANPRTSWAQDRIQAEDRVDFRTWAGVLGKGLGT